MRISRRRLRSMAVLAATAMSATLPAVTAAHATTATQPTITLTVDGQTPGTTVPTVSGTVTVTATITPVPGAPIQKVRYDVLDAPGLGGEIVPQAGQCDTACSFTFSIDTAALQSLAPGGVPVPRMSDGVHSIGVAAASANNANSVRTAVQVDNHRPQAGSDPSGQVLTLKASKTLTWTVRPSVSATAPSGTTISDVELEAPGTPLPVTHFTRNADSSWTLSLDVSSLPTSLQQMYAVATDSNGVVSRQLPTTLALDNGFALTPDQLPAVMLPSDWQYHSLNYGNAAWPACGSEANVYGAGATDIKLLVDGTTWQDSPVNAAALDYGLPSPSDGNLYQCWVPSIGNEPGTVVKPLPFGKHTLTWVLTDSNGVQESTSATTTVAVPLTSTWPSGSETLAAGTILHLTPTVTAPDGFSTVQSWTVTNQNGTTLASGTGATAPSVAVATPANQKTGGRLTLTMVSDHGYTTTQSFTYQTGWPTAAFAHTSATSITSGSWVELSADIWQRIAGTWVHDPAQYGQVTWQWAVLGSNVWHNGSGPTMSVYAPKPAGWWVHPGASACFRAVYNTVANQTAYGYDEVPGISAPVCVTVKP